MKTLTVKKPWGQFEQFTHNEVTTVKIITVKPGEALSLQSHAKRSEFLRVIDGGGIIEIGDNKYNAKEGGEYNVSVNIKHRVTAGLSGLAYLEISTGDFEENDEVRYEDKYGRA